MEIAELKLSLEELILGIDDLCAALQNPTDAFCAADPGPFEVGHAAVVKIQAIFKNYYVPGDAADARFTETLHGAICVEPEVMELARRVNQLKAVFRAKMDSYQDRLRGTAGTTLKKSQKSIAVRQMLTNIGYGRLSLKAIYRRIPVLEYEPKSIRFSGVMPRTIHKMSVSEALALLESKMYTSDSARIDYETLKEYPSHLPVAQIQFNPAGVKGNIIDSLTGKYADTKLFYLPILYAGPIVERDDIFLPSQFDPKRWPKKEKKVRGDKLIDDNEPLASTIRVFRYAEQSAPQSP